MKKALITGCLGQDGSYLAEHLMSLGYEVHGLAKGLALDNFNTVPEAVKVHCGDMRDELSIENIFRKVWPDEVYNLAGQVFVPTSWTQTTETFDVNTNGLARVLNCVLRMKPNTRVYQASSSEMYGNQTGALDELSPMVPVSPYGVSKLASHHLCSVYRLKGLFVVSGILFNHECIAAGTPLIVKYRGAVDVLPAEELLIPSHLTGPSCTLDYEGCGWEVWDGEKWASINTVTATRRRNDDKQHEMLSVEARGGVVEVTRHHNMIRDSGDVIGADKLVLGDGLKIGKYPKQDGQPTLVLEEMAEFLGLMVAEGCAWNSACQFTNADTTLISRVKSLWKRLTLGTVRIRSYPSGFENGISVSQLILSGAGTETHSWIVKQIYTKSGLKKVPKMILNAGDKVRAAFLSGYYAGDGLKAGNGLSFKTNSQVLAQGLCYLYSLEGKNIPSIYSEHRDGHIYYQVNEGTGVKGQHLRLAAKELRRIIELPPNLELAKRSIPRDWVIDLETETGQFMAGVGRVIVHNSPRRSDYMVTRKITKAIARWVCGDLEPLELGNLNASRDWGSAKDYVNAMHLMLQTSEPEDFVIGTGMSHTVGEFLREAVSAAGLGWIKVKDLVFSGSKDFVRGSNELFHLKADATKARSVLQWRPQITFREMVADMVQGDIQLEKQRRSLTEEVRA